VERTGGGGRCFERGEVRRISFCKDCSRQGAVGTSGYVLYSCSAEEKGLMNAPKKLAAKAEGELRVPSVGGAMVKQT